MRYLALAPDYDGTLASEGRVTPQTVAALKRLLASGRRLILVTGRDLPELLSIFPEVALFERVVTENGALLYAPATREQKLLCEAPSPLFLETLRRRGVPFSAGRCIVATRTPHETTVLEAIKDLGLELHLIFNKGAVMVLPSGMNKRVGLLAALQELGLSSHNIAGIGDAENDHAFLAMCECAVAVANALPSLKERADLVTHGANGEGVIEVIERILAEDLRNLEPRLTRHHILLGKREDGSEVFLRPYGGSLLLAGPSGSGKSTITAGLLERLAEKRYQFCLIDPEGDHQMEDALTLGERRRAPSVDEVAQALADPDQNVAVNLLGLPLADRPLFFAGLLPRLQEMRARTGRPHWIAVDEAHHLLPSIWVPAPATVPKDLRGLLLITTQPDHIAPAMLQPVDVVVAVGNGVHQTLAGFARTLELEPPPVSRQDLRPGETMVWMRNSGEPPFLVRPVPGQADRRRHLRKYAEGELGTDRSFYFRGPQSKLNLRAQNLVLFSQMADGVDDETWMHHLRRGDYSRWFRQDIKDEELAAEAEAVERHPDISPEESRRRIRAAIDARYTAAA